MAPGATGALLFGSRIRLSEGRVDEGFYVFQPEHAAAADLGRPRRGAAMNHPTERFLRLAKTVCGFLEGE